MDKIIKLLRSIPENSRETIHTSIFAIISAVSAVAFLLITSYFFKYTYLFFAKFSQEIFIISSFIIIMSTSLIVGLLLFKLRPDAAGSGIPQLKESYWKEIGYVNWKTVAVKFIAGVLSLGGGTSLGREGPTIYISAGLSSMVSGLLGYQKRMRRAPLIIGSASGLAAAFNTPIAAITFVLEEIIGDLNSRIIGRVVLASVIGAFVVYAIIGKQPAFELPNIDPTSIHVYLIYPITAFIASLFGVLYQRMTLFLRGKIKNQRIMPLWVMPCFGGLITWIIGISCYLATGKIGIFGLGYLDLSDALSNGFVWQTAGLLAVAKLFSSSASYGFGGCGGIFSPMLFIGGMVGFFISGFAGQWFPMSSSDQIAIAAVGMAACLGSLIRAPLTSVLIVFEMTHQFSLVPGLMIGIIVCMLSARLAGHHNFYDALLIQDGHEISKIKPPMDLRSWQNLPVSTIAGTKAIVITSLDKKNLDDIITKHPYRYFPVVTDDKITGMLSRSDVENIIKDGEYKPDKALTCYPDEPIREVANRFIESSSGTIVMVDRNSSSIIGIVTVHDILRAQASVNE